MRQSVVKFPERAKRFAALLGTAFVVVAWMAVTAQGITQAAEIQKRSGLRWEYLSSNHGEIAIPGDSDQQTGVVVADFDGDGVNDFIISCRIAAPALICYRRTADGWDRIVIDPELLQIEAGGAVYDIDGDGDPDVVFGGDWQSDEVWWWENPSPDFDPNRPWTRHRIKTGGATQHHDQVFADLLGTGRAQLFFWNQSAKTIFMAEIPDNPRAADGWPLMPVYSGDGGEAAKSFGYAEGMSACDIDGDGVPELLAGNTWFKHTGNRRFTPVRIAEIGGLIFAARFRPGKYPQIVISPGDADGPLCIYTCTDDEDPMNQANWKRTILIEKVIHGHSLQIADFDGDGNADIFCAEMAKWGDESRDDARAWILFGDGTGRFRTTRFAEGIGFHEARAADLDGDGRIDILSKPYNWRTPRLDIWLQRRTEGE